MKDLFNYKLKNATVNPNQTLIEQYFNYNTKLHAKAT